jgi:hypothetical protein
LRSGDRLNDKRLGKGGGRTLAARGGAQCAAARRDEKGAAGFIPSFLHSASLPLAQPFTDHTEQALCSAKKGQSRELGMTVVNSELSGPNISRELGITAQPKPASASLRKRRNEQNDEVWRLNAVGEVHRIH